MRRHHWLAGALLGAWSALAVIALTYLGSRLAGLPFVPFDIFDWMARVLPGAVIRFVIENMIGVIRGLNLGPTAALAKTAEQFIALAQFVIGGVVLGIVLAAAARRSARHLGRFGALFGLIGFVAVIAIEDARRFGATGPVAIGVVASSVLWLAVVFVGWGALLGRTIQLVSAVRRPAEVADETAPEVDDQRRRFLYVTGIGSFAVVVAGLGVRILSRETAVSATRALNAPVAPGTGNTGHLPLEGAPGRLEPVPGTRSELTSNKDFYRVDINTGPPHVDGASWRCELGGMVDRPLTLALDELRARPPASQAITQECISNPVGGDLISTTIYTGVRLRDLLAEAGLKPGAAAVAIESFDGFYESVPIAEARDERTLLVYAMNNEPLTPEHGFPLRICIPNHYGMKQPKWIRRLHVIDKDGPGYWVDRGWSRTAFVRTTSVTDVVAPGRPDRSDRAVPVGGIAFAGARGISKVEVQVDDGEWTTAELRVPPLSPLTWVQWRYLWPAPPGRHVLRVRATDGAGAVQEAGEAGTFPDGATGIYLVKENIRG